MLRHQNKRFQGRTTGFLILIMGTMVCLTAGLPGSAMAGHTDPQEDPSNPCEGECPQEPADPDGPDDSGPDVSEPIYLFSGEYHYNTTDLRIAGRGFDFALRRKYRSKTGGPTMMGANWDVSYNQYLEQRRSNLLFCDGTGRRDLFRNQGGGTYARDEYFCVIQEEPSGTFVMTLPDKTIKRFRPIDDTPTSGRLMEITDRNGNSMSFSYTLAGSLYNYYSTDHGSGCSDSGIESCVCSYDPYCCDTEWDNLCVYEAQALGYTVCEEDRREWRIAAINVTDTLNREILISLNADGFIESVSDWAGRTVHYEYYNDGDEGGTFGDLKSVTFPAVVDGNGFRVPHGHECPEGKTWTYTYTTGFADDRLNHNLLTVIDGKGQTYIQNVYAETADPLDFLYDRVVSQYYGGTATDDAPRFDYTYLEITPCAANNNADTKVIVNNRKGFVKEIYYDERNRLVIRRDYTGTAPDPAAPTTTTSNRPVNKLRPDDPDYFEKRFEYNQDSRLTRIEYPNGNVSEFVHELDLDPNAPRRYRANLREVRHWPGPLGGDQEVIIEQYEYEPGFGGGNGESFVTRYVDGSGNETLYEYDVCGNRTRTIHAIPDIVEDFECNAWGQMTARVLPDNGSSHRRRDQYTHYDNGPQMGYLQSETIDAGGFALTTTYEYDLVGNMTKVTDPRGHDTQYWVNQLNQVVRVVSREVTDGSGVRYERDYFYDANNNRVRVDVGNVDDQGISQANTHFTTIYEYDIIDRRTRICAEAGSYDVPLDKLDCSDLPADEFVTTEYEYDDNDNLSLVCYGEAVNGNQPYNLVRKLCDERDLLFQQIRADGDPSQSTTQRDYDGNGNLKTLREGLEDTPRVTTYTHDSYDRLLASTDAMGNVRTYHYDAKGNRVSVRTDGELLDVAGIAGNVRLSEVAYQYDTLDRLTREVVEFFDTTTGAPIDDGQATTAIEWSDNSQVTRIVDDNDHPTLIGYDTANRRLVITDAKGNTRTFGYDGNSNVTSLTEVDKSDLSAPDEVFTTTYAYDSLDRVIQSTDNMGNTHTFGHDSRYNHTLAIDALAHKTRYAYDGLSRLAATTYDMDGDGADGDGPDIVTAKGWDDSSRLTSQTDDNGNTTTYIYDVLFRMTGKRHADDTLHTYVYDVHHNPIATTDANGSAVTNTFDLLDRLTTRNIAPGPGVSDDTTIELYQYDGRSRIVRAEDNDSAVTHKYDSLGNTTEETLEANGGEWSGTGSATFDTLGNLLTLTNPGGRCVTNTFDELDRKATISDLLISDIAQYNYIGSYRVAQRDYSNNVRATFGYDNVRRMTRSKHQADLGTGAIRDHRTYTWDAMFNKTSRTDERTNTTHNYHYDAAYRLIRTIVNAGDGTLRDTTYNLDGVHNRIDVIGNPDPNAYVGTYTMDDVVPNPADYQMNQYTTTPSGARQYDANGNLITRTDPSGATTLATITYDYRNQMVEYHDLTTGQRHTYAYNCFGRRIAKIVDADGIADGPTQTRFFYGGQSQWQVIEEQDGQGSTLATYVYGNCIDEVLSMQRDVDTNGTSEDYFYHTDDMYNVMAITDAAGNIVERYEYGDYGQPVDPATLRPISGDPSGIGNYSLFTGRRYDPETGWYHYRTRYLDPHAGRFTTRDVIGIWGDPWESGNGYSYVGNNPWTFFDPYGFEACKEKTDDEGGDKKKKKKKKKGDEEENGPSEVVVVLKDGTKVRITAKTTEELAKKLRKIKEDEGEISKITIINHGSEEIQIVGPASVLAGHDKGTKDIGEALGEGAEIECAGCNVAAGKEGAEYIQELADATGATVTGYPGKVYYVPTRWGSVIVWRGGTPVTKSPQKSGP
ncbi:MAG: DUF4347 domain-containing protein [Phycisphaerae bacterium]|nr:DUF4347 domain-containing protein [Phycisphaerae bacterium]